MSEPTIKQIRRDFHSIIMNLEGAHIGEEPYMRLQDVLDALDFAIDGEIRKSSMSAEMQRITDDLKRKRAPKETSKEGKK